MIDSMVMDKKLEKAYVLYANENYFDIVSMCAKSIREFSNIHILVYLLDSDLKINIENCTTIKWNYKSNDDSSMYNITENSNFYINRAHKTIFDILTQRPAVVKHALLNYTDTAVYIDSDSIATPFIDRIFTLYPINEKYPYIAEGIYDWMHYNGRGGAMDANDLSTTLEHPGCELFGVNQYIRERYRTTNLFIANKNCIEFLEEWEWMCKHPKVLNNREHYAPFHEETIVNILLWKYNNLKGLPCVYTNGDSNRVDEVYSKCTFTGYPQLLGDWFRLPAHKEDLLVFHGEKRLDEMQKMIDKIKQFNPIKENKKILFVAPHMSTGGMPQYLLKKVQTLKYQYDIYVVEYSDVSPDYTVQKEQLKWMLGDKYFTLYEDKFELLKIIDNIQPDVVHLEDVPESFMDNDITLRLYGDRDRNYFIVESTHSSLTNPPSLYFHPDKFILPSKWIQQKFSEHLPQIPNDIWEYPIENYYKDQKLAQEFLKLNPKQKHVLMVGLFTSGKNQGEIFEIAKQLPEVQFHFVGNQAPNFAEYWEPLMKNKPNNCTVWGERDDVSNFYQACDVFYFSSKFELMPLSIKEALSYGMPCLFRRLDTYMDSYDNNPLVHYIDDNLDKTKKILCTLI
jgi:glycosyltransferase involved in cell wall biosynthesis